MNQSSPQRRLRQSQVGNVHDSKGARVRIMSRIAVVVALLVPASGGLLASVAGASSIHIVSTGHASGRYAVANASGEINKPSNIQIAVSSKPEMSGLVQWTVECRKGTKVTAPKKFKKTARFPGRIKVSFASSANLCDVAANVQLNGSGTVTISLESSS